ncbi:hypothetical protein Bca52824_059145 [Brassica carinata]|uniref:Uncharacterized protein n=1 Tax=Brassica carinata TaxID=52824 RepID=A0A8X7QTU4_BRACI|nr:hypothetical protein Bca52824_059145 [Brassica carinata]
MVAIYTAWNQELSRILFLLKCPLGLTVDLVEYELNVLISLSALSDEITKSILMICIFERHILRNPLHPLVKSINKLMSEMDFELPSSGMHQDMVNVLGMALMVVDRCSSDFVNRRFHVVVDQFFRVVAD